MSETFFIFDENDYMETVIRMSVDDLNQSLIDFLRTSFKGRKIEVSVLEEDSEMDETEFILSDPIAKERILKTVEKVRKGVGLKEYTTEELKQTFLNDSGK